MNTDLILVPLRNNQTDIIWGNKYILSLNRTLIGLSILIILGLFLACITAQRRTQQNLNRIAPIHTVHKHIELVINAHRTATEFLQSHYQSHLRKRPLAATECLTVPHLCTAVSFPMSDSHNRPSNCPRGLVCA